jgi:sugar fermentation stimulation protein A
MENSVELTVGHLGPIRFEPGYYVYVGSALGGLGARLRRHLRRDKPRHWHVDWLREVADLVAVAYRLGPERIECSVAERVAALPGATRPVPGFGSSDCRCRSHLFHFLEVPDLQFDATWGSVLLSNELGGAATRAWLESRRAVPSVSDRGDSDAGC